jgi:hypothetical protein
MFHAMELEEIHPEDARTFLRCVDPALFSSISTPQARVLLRGFVHFSHMQDMVCGDFLRRFYPDMWLTFLKVLLSPDLPMPTVTTADTYTTDLVRVCDRVRSMHTNKMSISRILMQTDNPLGVFHYWAAHVKFQVLYPRFLRHSWIKQRQMVLSFYYNDMRERVSEEFLVCMAHLGGCFPIPNGTSIAPFNENLILFAPAQNYTRLLVSGLNPPDTLRLLPTAYTSTGDYARWRERAVPFPDFMLDAFDVACPTGYPGPFRCNSSIGWRDMPWERPDPDHSILPELLEIRAWYRRKECIAVVNMPVPPRTSSGAVSLFKMDISSRFSINIL